MITKILPTKIEEHWKAIAAYLDKVMPPTPYGTKIDTDYLKTKVITEEMSLWLIYQNEKINGLLITTYTKEITSEKSSLLIYAIVAFEKLDTALIKEDFKTLQKYAKETGAQYISAYSNVPHVVKLVQDLGGNAEYAYLTLGVDQ